MKKSSLPDDVAETRRLQSIATFEKQKPPLDTGGFSLGSWLVIIGIDHRHPFSRILIN